ncbi:uncharacterized protein TRIADDRAFT_60379 [Trichoplax adhaerens]|uniref:Uncharacterized protein n=1 Tax=Trichoplax adhaerens TaxID=10228 RepID=B3S823_TRIAD|nr:predicted protein [Trichoplax adhaerens]EDV21119.1 predicted protein [Trichoplax adhaerens]|eukprot:XP_002116449.1 predicted protein [Trichoplax adhaerens]
MSDNAPFSAHNTDLTELNASGSDKNLAEHGDEPGYWYSLNDGIYLLMKIREKRLNYRMNDGENFPLKDLQEYSPTRENANKILLTDPFSIEQFNNISFIDDIKTIAGKHDRDEDGNDITARNNRWSNIPQLIIIPIIIKNHWISFRIRIDDNNGADILYSDPFGNTDLIKNLKKNRQTRNKITEALNLLCGKNIKLTESSKSFNQQGNNGSNCGPITFTNIRDYMKIEIPNSDLQSDEKYSIREFSKTGSSSIKKKKENDIKIYTEMIKKYGKLETKNDMQPSIEKSNSSTSEYEKKEKTQSDRSAKIPNPEKAKEIFETLNAQNSITSPKMLQDLKDLLTYVMTLSKSAATITKPIRQSFKEAPSDSNEIDERLNIISSSKPSKGLKRTFHGTIYQIALIALIAVRANAKRDQFALASEAEGYDKFDDLVVYTSTSVIYIQVKHRLDHTYKEKDFYSINQSEAKKCPLLWLYFDYWLRIKNSDDYMKNCKNKTHQFVFFSNCKVEIPSYLYEKATISPGYLFEGLEGRSFRFKKLPKDSDFVKCIFTHVKKQANKLEELLDAADKTKAKENLTKSLNHACCILRNVINDLQKARNHFYEQNSHHYILISDMAIITSKDPMRSKFREKMKKGQRILFDERSREIEDKINNIMLRQIYQFFEEFIVKLDQPDTSQLERLTYNEVRSKTELAATEVYSTLRACMIDWLADNKVCWLQSDEFDKIVKASKNEESRFYLLKHTETFKTEYHELIQDHKVSIQEIKIEALEKFLIDTDHKNLVMLLYGVGIQLRIYQTLSNLAINIQLTNGHS